MGHEFNNQRTIGDYFTLQRGKTYKSALLGQPGPVLLGLASIQRNGGFRSDSLKTYGGDSPDNLLLRTGELYVSLKDVTQAGDLLGSVARLPDTVVVGRLTQDTVKLEPRFADVPLDYLYWVMRTPQYRTYCRAHATGTTNLGLSRDDFLNFPVPEPTSERIILVGTLKALDDKIELNRRMNQTLEAMARAIFKSWFIDFDPVRAKVDGNEPPGLDPATAARFPDAFQDSPLGPIPRGWEVRPLSDQIEAVKGLSYKGKFLAEVGMPLHNLNSVMEGGGYKYAGLKRYVGEYKDRHIVRPGDLIVTNTEQGFDHLLIGYPAIIPKRFGDKGLFSHHLYRVRPLPGSHLTPEFFCLLLRSRRMHELIAGYTNGTTVNMLPADGLQRPEFVVPPAPLIDRFQEQLGPLLEKIEQIYDENVILAKTRDTLLPKLLAGELRVGGAEHLAEEVA